jgi:hypothetical protein
VKARYIHADVTDEKSLTKGFETSVAELGGLNGWYVLHSILGGRQVAKPITV